MTNDYERMSFAGYLRMLRERRRYSKSELARRADIDATYLGRIERGLLPPPRPKNLARLATALELSREERARFLELSGRSDPTPISDLDALSTHFPPMATTAAAWAAQPSESLTSRDHDDEQVATILEGMAKLQHQVERLLAERTRRNAAHSAARLREDEVLASVEAILAPHTQTGSGTAGTTGRRDVVHARGQESGELRELDGQEEVLDTIVQMVSSVPPLPSLERREILLATHWIDDMFDAVPYLRGELWSALGTALQRGWDVVHVMALNGRRGQSTAWVRAMIGLLGPPGHYRPHYFAGDTPIPLAQSFVLVPEAGALQLLTVPGTQQVTAGMLYPNYPIDGSALGRLFATLRENARPLLHTHRGLSRLVSHDIATGTGSELETEARYVALLAAEEHGGERLSIWPNFSMPTIPPHCLDRQTCSRYGVEDIGQLPPAIRHALAFMRQRHSLFELAARTIRYRSICNKQVVESFLQDGQYGVDHPLLESATRQERIDHLRVLLALLRETRFELALAVDPPPHLFHTGLEIMSAEQGGSVFLLGWRLLGGRHDTRIDSEITEPGVVKDFCLYFDTAWSQLPAQCRDKVQVIAWLEDQLHQLLSG